jgi:hypothetical protein
MRMGFLQKLFSPLGYIGGVILVLLGLSPAQVGEWLAGHIPAGLASWIGGNQGRWAFVLSGSLLFVCARYWRSRRDRELIVAVLTAEMLPTLPIPENRTPTGEVTNAEGDTILRAGGHAIGLYRSVPPGLWVDPFAGLPGHDTQRQ